MKTVIIFLCLIFIPVFYLSAQNKKDGTEFIYGSDEWHFELTPYFWMTSIYSAKEIGPVSFENDTRFNLMPDTLLTSTNQSLDVDEILNSTLVAYKSTNTRNVLTSRLKGISWAYLTDSDAYFLGCKQKGIVAIKRMEPKINFFEDEKNRCYWATVEMRIGVMMKNWRFWCGSNFSTS